MDTRDRFIEEALNAGRIEVLVEEALLRISRENGECIDIDITYLPRKRKEAREEVLEGLAGYLSDDHDPEGIFNTLICERPELYTALVEHIREHAGHGFLVDSERRLYPVTRLVLGHFLPEDWNPGYIRLVRIASAYGLEVQDLVRGYETGIYIYRSSECFSGRICTKPELRDFVLSRGIRRNRFLDSSSMGDYRTLLQYAYATGCQGVGDMLEKAMGININMFFLSGDGMENYRKIQIGGMND